jgi:hypothetical protein
MLNETDLGYACEKGNIELVKLHLAAGADLNAPSHHADTKGMTPFVCLKNGLHMAHQKSKRVEDIVWIAERLGGADASSRMKTEVNDAKREFSADQKRFHEVATELIKAGLKVDIGDFSSGPVETELYHHCKETQKSLSTNGSKDFPKDKGSTPQPIVDKPRVKTSP